MPSPSPQFRTTRWTMVVSAQENQHEALERLCETYWYPLYAFVRRGGHTAHDAQDLTQAFFERLLEKEWLDGVQPELGKFRTFLMMAMKRFLVNEWKSAQCLKRGGRAHAVPLEWTEAEERYTLEPASIDDQSAVFDRRWALTLLDQALVRLEKEQPTSEAFAVLKPALTAGHGGFDCASAAIKLGQNEGTVRVAVHRLRKRYREIFREEIAHTVAEPTEVDDEIRYLVEVLARG